MTSSEYKFDCCALASKAFSRGATRVFFQNISRGTKSGEICFFPLETKKTTLFVENFKIQEGPWYPASLSDAHVVE